MTIDDKILDIAVHVRAAVSNWVRDNREIDNHDLNGACAVASNALWKALCALGYKADFIVRHNEYFGGHCWVEHEGFVIDITATQFGGPEIACYSVNEIPEWFPDQLLHSPGQDDEEMFSLIEERGNDGVEFTSDWGYQNALIYEDKTAKLVEYFKLSRLL